MWCVSSARRPCWRATDERRFHAAHRGAGDEPLSFLLQALFILALAFGGAPPVQAQGLWNEIFGAPAAKPAPCVLDKCLNGGAGSPAQPAPAEPQSAPAPPMAQAGPPAVAPGAF